MSSTAVVTTGLDLPYQVAFNNGNMYIAGGDSNAVAEVSGSPAHGPAPYTPSTIVTNSVGFRITTLAFDPEGDLWYGNQSGGNVAEITAAQLAGPTPVTPTGFFLCLAAMPTPSRL